MAKAEPDKESVGRPRSTAPKKTGRKAIKAGRKKTAKRANRRPIKGSHGTCFVLTPFKEPFDSYYEAIIGPAIESVGLTPYRGDSLFRPSPIMGDVWRMIQDAKVLVAELTEKNANVFYELGLGHAIGKPVIMIAETLGDVPFDLQPLRVLLYDKNHPAWGAKLRKDIGKALRETLSDSAEAVPPMFRKIVKSQAPEESETTARLADIEGQLAVLRANQSRFGGVFGAPIGDERRFKTRLQRVNSRTEAIRLAKRAAQGGIPLTAIYKIISEQVNPREARAVLKSMHGIRPSSSLLIDDEGDDKQGV